MTQAFSKQELDDVSEMANMFDINTRIINFPNKERIPDARSRLLNILLAESHESLVHFLDYDDYLYQNAYSVFKRLTDEDCYSSLFYFARVERGFHTIKNGHDILVYCDNPYKGKGTVEDLKEDNFCPLHSYIINKKLACKLGEKLFFDEAYEVLEDYDFLLRYCELGCNFKGLEETIGIYCFRDDNSNTTSVSSIGVGESRKIDKWASGRKRIRYIKKKLGYA